MPQSNKSVIPNNITIIYLVFLQTIWSTALGGNGRFWREGVRTKKKLEKKLKLPSYLNEKSLITWSDLEKKLTENSLQILSEFILQGNPLYFYRLLVRFQKKSNIGGVFKFLHPDPQLDQNLKPTRNLCGQLLYVYMCLVFHIS